MLKPCARCVLVSAAAIVLLVDKASLAKMGQAGFFAAIVPIPPPPLALSVFVLASLTILMGMLLGRRVYGRRDLRAGQGPPRGGAESCPG
ncbi:hypothetical protein B0H14DRAFT_2736596 [Mycena olivaceomarginata]|nr:hypothetical protein B0H14DRAFT_2736596 [Mycena olivaceomarginata]